MNHSQFWSVWKSLEPDRRKRIASAVTRGERLPDERDADVAVDLAVHRQRGFRILLFAPIISVLVNLTFVVAVGAGVVGVIASILIAMVLGLFTTPVWRKWTIVLRRAEGLNRQAGSDGRMNDGQ